MIHALVLRPLFLFALATPCLAQEIWVDPVAGSDSNPGTFTLPMQTLTNAVTVAGPSTRILLLPGTYSTATNGESLPISPGLVPQQNLLIRGFDGAIFDLGGSNLPLFRMVNGADGARITNLTITNADQTGWWTRVVNSGTGVNSNDAARNVEFDRCRLINVNRGFVLWTNDNVQGWRIHDNLFVNCTNDAILEYTGDNEIYNNTFVTGTWKAYISDSATSRCYNNLIVGYNIAFENNNAASNIARYQNNWVWQTTTTMQGAGLLGGLPASNRIGIDPQLVNPAGGDYRPRATSPLLDAGTAAIFARADQDNVARIVDSDLNGSQLPDIGAYERAPIAHTTTYDPLALLFWIHVTGTVPNSFAFVLFSFDDGLIRVPGLGPILLDPVTTIPAWLTGGIPNTWVLPLSTVPPFLPGTRLVTQVLAAVPGASTLVCGNQQWTQL